MTINMSRWMKEIDYIDLDSLGKVIEDLGYKVFKYLKESKKGETIIFDFRILREEK